MSAWQSGIVVDLLILTALLAVAMVLVRFVGVLQRSRVPVSILAGLLGLLFGPSVLDLVPTDIEAMELIVYHAFAITFIAVGLQAMPLTDRPGSARSLALGNASIGVTQAILGLAFVALWLALAQPLHPGFGLMITLGFQQGPGQALSLGGEWEKAGMIDGGQIGLIFATLGFLYCVVLGVPLVAIARRRGWLTAEDEIAPEADSGPKPAPDDDPAVTHRSPRSPRDRVPHEPLSMQLVIIGCVYLAVFGFITALSAPLPEGSKLRATFWGLHFIVGSLFAIALRRLARHTRFTHVFDDPLLARISVVAVDITTAGAIAAVQLSVLAQYLVPILLMTAMAGGVTLLGCMWLARRAFPEAPFAHALVLFGMGTGTIPTGLALLRMLDPELRGPVARNAVIGAAASVPFNFPMFIVVIPIAVSLWSQGALIAIGGPLAMLAVYLAVLAWSWRAFTPLRLLRPLRSLWPPTPEQTRRKP